MKLIVDLINQGGFSEYGDYITGKKQEKL